MDGTLEVDALWARRHMARAVRQPRHLRWWWGPRDRFVLTGFWLVGHAYPYEWVREQEASSRPAVLVSEQGHGRVHGVGQVSPLYFDVGTGKRP